jgi:hypothetical protein
LRELQHAAQQVQALELHDAVRAMVKVALEFGSTHGAQLAVEIAMKARVGKVTSHE